MLSFDALMIVLNGLTAGLLLEEAMRPVRPGDIWHLVIVAMFSCNIVLISVNVMHWLRVYA